MLELQSTRDELTCLIGLYGLNLSTTKGEVVVPSEFNNRDHFSFHNRRNSPPPYPPPPPPNMGRGPLGGGRQGLPDMGGRAPPFPPDRGPMMFSTPPPIHDSEGRRNEKFPYHLDHIDPEFDDKATRTLFVGNSGCEHH